MCAHNFLAIVCTFHVVTKSEYINTYLVSDKIAKFALPLWAS